MTEADFSVEFAFRSLARPIQIGVRRLTGITGFATTLHTSTDPRPRVFSRFLHVRRVVWTAQWLAQARMTHGNNLDLRKIAWLAWVHDINRWPFAHNAEIDFFTKHRRFDQAEDFHRYCRDNDIAINTHLVDLKNIAKKNIAPLSPEGRIVLLADIVTGFIEDPMLAISGLDLVPNIVPVEIAEVLRLPLSDKNFRARLLDLNVTLNVSRAVERFADGFDSIFLEAVVRLVTGHGFDQHDPLGTENFDRIKSLIREKFIATLLYPLNNERISRGSLLRRQIIDPLINILGESSARVLTTVDEDGVLALASNNAIIPSPSPKPFLPDIDYLWNKEPNLSFRHNSKY